MPKAAALRRTGFLLAASLFAAGRLCGAEEPGALPLTAPAGEPCDFGRQPPPLTGRWLIVLGENAGVEDYLSEAELEVGVCGEERGVDIVIETLKSAGHFNRLLNDPEVTAVFYSGHGKGGKLSLDDSADVVSASDIDAERTRSKELPFYTIACESGQGDWDVPFKRAYGNYLSNWATGISFFRDLSEIHSEGRKAFDPFQVPVNQAATAAVEPIYYAEHPEQLPKLVARYGDEFAAIYAMLSSLKEARARLLGLRGKIEAVPAGAEGEKRLKGELLERIARWLPRIEKAEGSYRLLVKKKFPERLDRIPPA